MIHKEAVMTSRKSKDLSGYSDKHGRSKRIKREQWGWSNPGDRPILLWISKFDLKIPEEYQRDKKSVESVGKIAREFQWAKFCPIAVSKDKEGNLWVNDGGHRLRASLLRDDIQMLPCSVTEGLSLAEEASIFADSAKCRNTISVYDRFVAQVVADDTIALQVKAIIEKHGYKPAKDRSKYAFKAIGALSKIVSEDAILADIVFGFCANMAEDGERIDALIIKGLFYLQQNINEQVDLFSGKYAKKLMKYGLNALVVSVARNRIITGSGGTKVAAAALLQLINKGCTHKLTMD